MASLKSMNAGLSNNGTAMNAQTEMTDGLLNACRLAGVDYETALKIKAYMPVSSHLTKPDAGGGEGRLNNAVRDLIEGHLIHYGRKNGQDISLEINGELAWIVPFDLWSELQAAYDQTNTLSERLAKASQRIGEIARGERVSQWETETSGDMVSIRHVTVKEPAPPSGVPVELSVVPMPAYIYDRECSENERVLPIAAVEHYADARVSEETRELVDGLRKAITQAEIRICTHDETHRGGAIWEICDQCGAKWADDEGGKPEFKWPEAIVELNALIAKYTQTQKESK
jgi:hypothetical protein